MAARWLQIHCPEDPVSRQLKGSVREPGVLGEIGGPTNTSLIPCSLLQPRRQSKHRGTPDS